MQSNDIFLRNMTQPYAEPFFWRVQNFRCVPSYHVCNYQVVLQINQALCNYSVEGATKLLKVILMLQKICAGGAGLLSNEKLAKSCENDFTIIKII